MDVMLKERDEMQVYMTSRGTVIKRALNSAGLAGIRQSWRFLNAMKDTVYVPNPISLVDNELEMEFVPDEAIVDPEQLRRSTIKMLHVFRQRGIVHGDLTSPNLRVRGNSPVAVDWEDAIFALTDNVPSKRPKPDLTHVFPVIVHRTGDSSRILRRWLAIREHINYFFGWGTFIDIGTNLGDFCALAALDGMSSIGVDIEDARIEKARQMWSLIETCTFHRNTGIDYRFSPVEVAALLSTWAYMVRDYGFAFARTVLEYCISKAQCFLFETQLYGDGPGPEFLKTDDDVVSLLKGAGAMIVKPIITLPVAGREAHRTVFLASNKVPYTFK